MKSFIITCVLFVGTIASAQEVIGSGGTVGTNGTETLQWTIGETVTSTLSNGTNTTTQGFHQTQLSVTAIDDVELVYDVSIYPNPTHSLLQIDISDLNEDLNIQLFDAAGKLLDQFSYLKGQSSNTMNFSSHERGAYYLRIIGTNTTQSYSVVKQ